MILEQLRKGEHLLDVLVIVLVVLSITNQRSLVLCRCVLRSPLTKPHVSTGFSANGNGASPVANGKRGPAARAKQAVSRLTPSPQKVLTADARL